jgi:Tol biopolymer transport system component
MTITLLAVSAPTVSARTPPGLSTKLLHKVRTAGVKKIRAPVLSPSRDKMVFVGEFQETWQFVPIRISVPRADIWLINTDLTGLRRLTRDGYSDDPSWSPSGCTIAFVDYGSVKVLDLRTGRIRGLRGLKASKPYTMECDYEMYEKPLWSPNGLGILARSGNGCGGPVVVVRARVGTRLLEKDIWDDVHWDTRSRLVVERSGSKPEHIAVRW